MKTTLHHRNRKAPLRELARLLPAGCVLALTLCIGSLLPGLPSLPTVEPAGSPSNLLTQTIPAEQSSLPTVMAAPPATDHTAESSPQVRIITLGSTERGVSLVGTDLHTPIIPRQALGRGFGPHALPISASPSLLILGMLLRP